MSNSFTDSYQPRVPLAGRRVLVAMSGGVDSSVAAVLLASAGAEVTGATFKNFCFTEAGELPGRSCCSVEAVADALAVCRAIGIPHTLVDETERFGRNVIDDFDAEYRAGRTPNPCARCNSAVRFPRLLEEASRLGCDYVATGHYARVCMSDDRLFLARGLDGDKDQSYFLAGMDPGSYVRVLFPLGGLRKARTRELAREAGLHVHEKPESQDVCFLAGRSLRDYLGGRGLLRPGPVLGPEGERLGEHPGAELYTVGQRHGLGVAGGRPLYVTRVDVTGGTVHLGDEPALRAGTVTCDSAWLHPALDDTAAGEARDGLTAKIRYRGVGAPVADLSLEGEWLRVRLAEPVKAAAPGQLLVLYAGDLVMGRGIIEAAE